MFAFSIGVNALSPLSNIFLVVFSIEYPLKIKKKNTDLRTKLPCLYIYFLFIYG